MITAPMAVGLAIISRPLVLTIFGEKWSDAIPVMAVISFYVLFSSLDFNSGEVFKAQGRPEIIPRIQILNLVIAVPVLFWSVTNFGTIIAVAWAQAALAVVMGITRLLIVAHFLNIPKIQIFQVFKPPFISTGLMTTIIILVLRLTEGATPILQLFLTIPIGAMVYGVSLWLLERDAVLTAWKVLRHALARGNK
jgi:O-antigen/teichoic acid export membrane protein